MGESYGGAIRKKDLELAIERIPGFRRPRRDLEQYQTPSWLVAEMAYMAAMKKDLGEIASDLGCGTGRIAAALAMLGVEEVLCIDISCTDLEEAMRNLEKLGLRDRVELLCWDIARSAPRKLGLVMMNPPFGVHRRGADIAFLESAMSASDKIYSLHKYSEKSLELIRRKASEKGFSVELIGIYNMEIPAMFETHRKRIHRFPIMMLRIYREQGKG